MNKRNITWAEYGELIDSLLNDLRDEGGSYDLCVGISRGGLPIAVETSHRLNIPMESLKVHSYAKMKKQSLPVIEDNLLPNIKGQKVLIVDDICDTGDTFFTVTEWLALKQPQSVTTASLIVKRSSHFIPDFSCELVNSNVWVVFPYEAEA